MAKMITISDLKHRLVVCSMDDVIMSATGTYQLARKGIYTGWADITPKTPSTFAVNGFTVKESRDKPTHEITMRFRPDVEISSAAWLYEERRISAPRWFKITQVIEKDPWFCFYCRLVERSDDATPPVEPGVEIERTIFDAVEDADPPDWAVRR